MFTVVELSLIDGEIRLGLPVVNIFRNVVYRLDDAFHGLQDPSRLTRSVWRDDSDEPGSRGATDERTYRAMASKLSIALWKAVT